MPWPGLPRWSANDVASVGLDMDGETVVRGTVRSPKFVSGTSGWIIDADGTAEFQSATVRGTLNADDIVAGTLDVANRVADLAITTAKIDDLAVTNAKVGLLAVDTAQIAALAVTNAKIGLLAVDTAQIAALAVTNAKINDLNATKVTAGYLSAARIEAGSLTTERLVVGSADNLCSNPGFESGDFTGYYTSDGGATGWTVAATASSRSGGYTARFDPTGQSSQADLFPNSSTTTWKDIFSQPSATEGDIHYFEAWCRGTTPGTAWNDCKCQVLYYDDTDALVGSTAGATVTPTTAWQKIPGVTGTAPATTAYVVFDVAVVNSGQAGIIYVEDLYGRRQVGTSIIEDLAVTNAKIGSLAVTAAKIANATITDAQISSLNADKITAGTLDADTVTVSGTLDAAALIINGSRVTAGTVATGYIASTLTGKIMRATQSVDAYSWSSDTDTAMRQDAAGQLYFIVNGNAQYYINTTRNLLSNNLFNNSDKSYDIGEALKAFDNVYAYSYPAVSDLAEKTDVAKSELGLDFIRQLRGAQWRWRDTADKAALDEAADTMEKLRTLQQSQLDVDGVETAASRATSVSIGKIAEGLTGLRKPGRRIHHGLVAQEVAAALRRLNIPTADFGGLVIDKSGRHLLRYDEFVAPIINSIGENDKRLARLEALWTSTQT